MKKYLILLLIPLIFGCATFDNKLTKFTHKDSSGKIIGSWELSAPAEAHAELTTLEFKLVYDGKTANILKDLLLMKAADTDINVSNKEGK